MPVHKPDGLSFFGPFAMFGGSKEPAKEPPRLKEAPAAKDVQTPNPVKAQVPAAPERGAGAKQGVSPLTSMFGWLAPAAPKAEPHTPAAPPLQSEVTPLQSELPPVQTAAPPEQLSPAIQAAAPKADAPQSAAPKALFDPQDTIATVLASNLVFATHGDGNRHLLIETLEGIDNPAMRTKVLTEYSAMKGSSLSGVLGAQLEDNDLKAAQQLIAPERGKAEEEIAKMDPVERAAKTARARAQAIKLNASLVVMDTDEDTIFKTLGYTSPVEVELIRREYRRMQPGRSLYNDLDHSLSGEDLDQATAGLSGDPLQSAAAALENAVDLDGDDEERVKETFRRLDKGQIEALQGEKFGGIATRARDAMGGSDRDIVDQYVGGNRAGGDGLDLADQLGRIGQMRDDAIKPEVFISKLEQMDPTDRIMATMVFNVNAALKADDPDDVETLESLAEDKFSGFEKDRVIALLHGNEADARAAEFMDGVDGPGTREEKVERALSIDRSTEQGKALFNAVSKRIEAYGEGTVDARIQSEYDDDIFSDKDDDRAAAQILAKGEIDVSLQLRRAIEAADRATARDLVKGLDREKLQEVRRTFAQNEDWDQFDWSMTETFGPKQNPWGGSSQGGGGDWIQIRNTLWFGPKAERPLSMQVQEDREVYEEEKDWFTTALEDTVGIGRTSEDMTAKLGRVESSVGADGALVPGVTQEDYKERGSLYQDSVGNHQKQKTDVADATTAGFKGVGHVLTALLAPELLPVVNALTSSASVALKQGMLGEGYAGQRGEEFSIGVEAFKDAGKGFMGLFAPFQDLSRRGEFVMDAGFGVGGDVATGLYEGKSLGEIVRTSGRNVMDLAAGAVIDAKTEDAHKGFVDGNGGLPREVALGARSAHRAAAKEIYGSLWGHKELGAHVTGALGTAVTDYAESSGESRSTDKKELEAKQKKEADEKKAQLAAEQAQRDAAHQAAESP